MKYEKRIVLFTLFVMNLVDQPAPEVTIQQGVLSGKISPDGSFYEYLGIPYATTNSSTRFKAPLPPPSWDGVFKAIDEIYQCPQNSVFGIVGTEDCLKINVYVPVNGKKPLPVMVFVHGGAFILGSGGKVLYAPDFLVEQDVILVTFNYRLGALGFLCLGTKDAPGNAGLKDQITALRWVKKNIADFGGDPDNITIFGQSAGGTSVSLLLASEATTGLFKRAIVQSGSSISSWAINRNPVWVASLIAKHLGHDTQDPDKIYQFLSKAPFADLVKAKPEKPLGKYLDTQLLHLPCVEKYIPGEEAVITDLPYNLLAQNLKRNVSVMFGSTSKEGLFIVSRDDDKTIQTRDEKYLFASDLELPSEAEAEKEDNIARQFYFGNDRMSMKNRLNISDLFTHLYFEVPTILESELLMEHAKEPIYNYYFNYAGGRNFLKYLTGFKQETGACHADELFYLFKGHLWPFPINKKDQQMINWMTRLWTNFAKYGDPTASSDLPVQWTPSSKGNIRFLHIDEELKLGGLPNPQAYRLWGNMYRKYRKKHVPTY